MTPREDLRIEALRLAHNTYGGNEAGAEDVVTRAEAYLAFLDPQSTPTGDVGRRLVDALRDAGVVLAP